MFWVNKGRTGGKYQILFKNSTGTFLNRDNESKYLNNEKYIMYTSFNYRKKKKIGYSACTEELLCCCQA